MDEQTFKNSQDSLFSYASKLYNTGEYKELEKLFSKFLKKSFDVRFWNIYIDYVNKISTKNVRLLDVYSFVTSHFDCSYFSYEYVSSYINELQTTENTDLIRKTYHKYMIPMHNLGMLWNDYEKWEMRVNKLTAKSFIDQIQLTYTLSSNTYQRLLPHIETNHFFRIFDIELENPLKLATKQFESRLNFLFNFYLNKFPTSSPLLFLYSFYMKEQAKEKMENTIKENQKNNTEESLFSTFLSIFYSFQYNKEYFNFNDLRNKDLITINHLNWLFKNQGIEAFREKFNAIKETASPYIFIYVAKAELYQGGDKEKTYKIFTEAIEKFKEDSIVNEEFFNLFLNLGDDDNIRRLFKKLNKTEVMWDLMIEYEQRHGDFQDFQNLLTQKQTALASKEILPAVAIKTIKIKNKGSQGVYETAFKSFGFLGLQITTSDLMTDFMKRLPKLEDSENLLSNLDNRKVIELLQSI